QIGGQRRKPVKLVLGPAKFDGNVPALDVASFIQPFPKTLQEACLAFTRTEAEISDHRHRRLLPPRALHLDREQQAAADQSNELTPFYVEHGDVLPYAYSRADRPIRRFSARAACLRAEARSLGQT